MCAQVIEFSEAARALRRRRLRTKRAAMVVHAYYPWDTHVRRHAQALAQEGVKVDVVCLRDRGEPAFEVVDGVEVHRLPVGRDRARPKWHYALEYLAFFILAGAKLTALALRRRHAVVQVHTPPDALVFCTLGCRALGAHVVLDIHDLGPELYSSKFKLDPGDATYRVLARLERMAVRYADRVVTSSAAFRDRLIERGAAPAKVAALLNAPDPRLFDRFSARSASRRLAYLERPSGRPDEFVLVNHGTLVERYGLDNAIRAVALLRDDIPGIRLRVFGDGDHRPALERLTRELDLQSRVSFEGVVDAAYVAETIGDADVGIVPSRIDGHMSLAMPTKLLEYVLLGVPVVATRTAVLSGMFGDEEVRYAEPSPESLAEQVRWVHDHPAEAAEMTRRAYEAFAPFRWERAREAYLQTIGAS